MSYRIIHIGDIEGDEPFQNTLDSILEAQEENESILLLVNSQGGDVHIAHGLCQIIYGLRGKHPVVGLATGQVASAALYVFGACEHRLAFRDTIFTWHATQMQGSFPGDARLLELQETIWRRYLGNYRGEWVENILQSRTSGPNYHFSAEEAKALGLVQDYTETLDDAIALAVSLRKEDKNE